jgi:hypothetical protein
MVVAHNDLELAQWSARQLKVYSAMPLLNAVAPWILTSVIRGKSIQNILSPTAHTLYTQNTSVNCIHTLYPHLAKLPCSTWQSLPLQRRIHSRKYGWKAGVGDHACRSSAPPPCSSTPKRRQIRPATRGARHHKYMLANRMRSI